MDTGTEADLGLSVSRGPNVRTETGVDLSDFVIDEYYEYDCGYPCTPNGCCGHSTDIPLSFSVGGATFNVYGSESGDFPDSKENIQLVRSVVTALRDACLKSEVCNTASP